MTTEELCAASGLTPRQLQTWLESGLLDAAIVAGDGGRRREFAAGQVERVRLILALHRKGVALSQLARAGLADLAGKAYVVFDGRELRACPDAAAAIGTVVKAKQPCRAVDLSAIRTGAAE
jgi:hypothetical protein